MLGSGRRHYIFSHMVVVVVVVLHGFPCWYNYSPGGLFV
jgi:hypothetical protein